MKKILLLSMLVVLFACSSDDKAIDQVFAGVTNGSVLRTIGFVQADLDVTDLQDRFNVILEQQDAEDGGLLERIDVFATYIDRDGSNGLISEAEVQVSTIEKQDIELGPEGLPRFNLDYSLQELLTSLQVSQSAISCDDQIVLRLLIRLNDGRTFTVGSGGSCIIAFETFFSSPYRYIINLVEPISPDLFTGRYWYSSVLDGPFGPTFGAPHLVEIKAGPRNNTRTVTFPGPPDAPSFSTPTKPFYFTIGCGQSSFWENQLRKVTVNCSERADDILLGPDTVSAPLSPLEDSVFELWFVEGYLGFDGSTGVGTVPSRIRLDKQ